jgi:hypothetical protein
MLTTDEVLAKKSYLKRALYLARNQIAHEVIRHYLSNPTMETMSSEVGINYMDPRGGEFLTGARQAFQVCSNALFAGRAANRPAAADSSELEMELDLEVGDSVINSSSSSSSTFGASTRHAPRSHPAAKTATEKRLEFLGEALKTAALGRNRSSRSRSRSKGGNGANNGGADSSGSSDDDAAAAQQKQSQVLQSAQATQQQEMQQQEQDTDLYINGIAPPIEYVSAWNAATKPPSAAFAPRAISEIMDDNLIHFFNMAFDAVKDTHDVHHTMHQV